ncbi:MAG: tyrosine--tRNA ligase [Spirochaetia bacterium]|nr:tyrosine--tRNA ligase [Spirochaetia bacterium]
MSEDASHNEIQLTGDLLIQFNEIIRGCEEVLPVEQLKEKLLKSNKTGRPLRIKAGFDPTAPDLHLGHTVLLQKLKTFQDFGHEVLFLIGDYTAMIGDPSGKSETRKALSADEVKKNAETYEKQVYKVLDKNKTNVVFNSQWLGKMSLKDVLELTSRYTVARLLERNDFQKRYEEKQPISLVEFMYPLLQGYDSVHLKADVELGGTDQKFNLLVGRVLQEHYHTEAQIIMTLPLLVGLDGENKMSKSLNNYVALQEPAVEIYGKIMSISDELMWNYYRLISALSMSEIENYKSQAAEGSIHPKEVKSKLAEEIASRFQGKEETGRAKKEWEAIHSPKNRGIPDEIDEWKANTDDLSEGKLGILNALRLSGMVSSNSDARRTIESGGLHLLVDGKEETIKDTKRYLETGEYTFRVGKRKFIRIIVS